jgi:hypothetical protein
LEHDLAQDKPGKKARIGARFGAWQTAKKHAMEHDLVHGKPRKKARIGARSGARQAVEKGTRWRTIGARQTAEKSTHWSTIWCTANREKKSAHWSTIWCTRNREKKHTLEHDLVHGRGNCLLDIRFRLISHVLEAVYF